MPDSKYFAIQYRGPRKRDLIMDRLSRRRYVITILDDLINHQLVVQVTHEKHRGHLQIICKQFGGAYLGEVDPPISAVEEPEVVTTGSDATFTVNDIVAVSEDEFKPMREVDIPREVFEKLKDPDHPDPVVDEDDDL